MTCFQVATISRSNTLRDAENVFIYTSFSILEKYCLLILETALLGRGDKENTWWLRLVFL